MQGPQFASGIVQMGLSTPLTHDGVCSGFKYIAYRE
jgi:hypothetical protein